MPHKKPASKKSATALHRDIGKQNPFDLPEQEAYLNLRRTANLLADEFAALFKSRGLSETGYNILRILRAAPPQGLPCLDVADQLVRKMPDITRLTNRLLEKGWIARNRSKQDKRVVLLTLTPAGKRLVDALDQPVLDLHQQQLGHLSQKQLNTLARLLEQARQTTTD
ncbi:MAG: MarR family transcriptional regulator [Planctomycetota bacterium]